MANKVNIEEDIFFSHFECYSMVKERYKIKLYIIIGECLHKLWLKTATVVTGVTNAAYPLGCKMVCVNIDQ